MASVAEPKAVVAHTTSLARRIEADYQRHYKPQRRPTCVQLDYMERLLRYLARHAVTDDHGRTSVRTTWPQLAKGVGFPVNGMGAKQIEDRYGSRVKNTVGYLMRARYVDGWDVVYEGRKPTGILVRLPAGVAQLVGATRYRSDKPPHVPPARSRPRGDHAAPMPVVPRGCERADHEPSTSHFSGGKVDGPTGGPLRGGGDSKAVKSRNPSVTAVGARGRALSTRDRAHLTTKVRVALIGDWSTNGSVEETGDEVLGRLPWLAGVPIDIVAREAARLWMPGVNLALSSLWQERFEVAAVQIERHGLCGQGGPGLAAATVIDLVRGGWEDELRDRRAVRAPRPRSLGAIAVCARRLARQWRRHARLRAARRAEVAADV